MQGRLRQVLYAISNRNRMKNRMCTRASGPCYAVKFLSQNCNTIQISPKIVQHRVGSILWNFSKTFPRNRLTKSWTASNLRNGDVKVLPYNESSFSRGRPKMWNTITHAPAVSSERSAVSLSKGVWREFSALLGKTVNRCDSVDKKNERDGTRFWQLNPLCILTGSLLTAEHSVGKW